VRAANFVYRASGDVGVVDSTFGWPEAPLQGAGEVFKGVSADEQRAGKAIFGTEATNG
jgi:hypothetical protein